MTFVEVLDLFEYWRSFPPEHEMMAMFARVFTTWQPANARAMTPEEHMRSIEERWAAGAMSPKQLFETMGGAISLDGSRGAGLTGRNLPGIGPFPGT